jgi:predicted component of type VI protein secretion system
MGDGALLKGHGQKTDGKETIELLVTRNKTFLKLEIVLRYTSIPIQFKECYFSNVTQCRINNNNNNSIKFFIIYVPSQQPQGQLQTQHSADTGESITT